MDTVFWLAAGLNAALLAIASAVALVRVRGLVRCRATSEALAQRAVELANGREIDRLLDEARSQTTPGYATMVAAGLQSYVAATRAPGRLGAVELARRAMARELTLVAEGLRSGLPAVALVAATAPFVGLAGAAIKALAVFEAVGRGGSAFSREVPTQLSQALVLAVIGLVVSILATVVSRLLSAQGDAMAAKLDRWRGEFLDALENRHEGQTAGVPPASASPAEGATGAADGAGEAGRSRRGLLVGIGALVGAPTTLAVMKLLEPRLSRIRGALARTKHSYAQQGEDLVLENLLIAHLGIPAPSYLDIGAFDPVVSNNTFLLYEQGFWGVLVEPNPAYARRLAEVRPRDTVLNVGIGISDVAEADYYIIRFDDQANTFSPEQVEKLKQEGKEVERVVKMPLVNVNEVIAAHFQAAPDLVSLDTEGLDLDILRTFDFRRYRPAVFCVETLREEDGLQNTAILDLMAANGYAARGGTFVNTVFVDRARLRG